MTKVSKTEQHEAIAKLRKMLKPGARIWCICTHVSSSGMSRNIKFVIPYRDQRQHYPHKDANGKTDFNRPVKRYESRIFDISWLMGRALGYRMENNGGLRIGGCGMDMGFNTVYNLGHKLWPKGTSKPHGTRNGEADSDGGYTLKHEWL